MTTMHYHPITGAPKQKEAARRYNLDCFGNGEDPYAEPIYFVTEKPDDWTDEQWSKYQEWAALMQRRYAARQEEAEKMATITRILNHVAQKPRTLPGTPETHLEQLMIGG